MFALLRSVRFFDPELGELHRSRGLWRGSLQLLGAETPLAISGPRQAPDPDALQLARSAPRLVHVARHAIEAAVFEHIQPYLEAIASGEMPLLDPRLPAPAEPSEVWPYISFRYAAVTSPGAQRVTEFGIAIPWDEEHTLGARFADGMLFEFCGSVLAP